MGDGGRRERGGMGKGEAGERSEAIGEIYFSIFDFKFRLSN